jgi:DNA-binding PadR family transcriptional regulator
MRREELDIVAAMLGDPIAWHFGLVVSGAAGIPAGTAYPAMARLERSGWLESRWDEAPLGTARRRLYRLTGAGQRAGLEIVREKPQRSGARRRRFGLPASQGQLG